MHERAAVSRAAASLASKGPGPSAVSVTLGPGIERAVAEAVWREAVAGTWAEHLEVKWERGRHGLRCFECGREYPGDDLDPCPGCGGDGLVVEAAAEVLVRREVP